MVKSVADSVAFPPQASQPVDAGLRDAALDIVSPSRVNASSDTGIEVFRERSRASANVIKIPALGQLQTFPVQ